MSNYTIYAMTPDYLGEPVEQEDMDSYNTLVEEELRAIGLDHEYRVIVTENTQGFSFYDVRSVPAQIQEAVERAWSRFGVRAMDWNRGDTQESPEEMAIDALCEAMPFLRQLQGALRFDSGREVFHVNGVIMDRDHLTRLIAHIETALGGMYCV